MGGVRLQAACTLDPGIQLLRVEAPEHFLVALVDSAHVCAAPELGVHHTARQECAHLRNRRGTVTPNADRAVSSVAEQNLKVGGCATLDWNQVVVGAETTATQLPFLLVRSDLSHLLCLQLGNPLERP